MRKLPVSALMLAFVISSANSEEELYSLSLEQLINVPVTSTAVIADTFSHTSYSVTPSAPADWRHLGVRNPGELLNHMPSSVARLAGGSLAGWRFVAIWIPNPPVVSRCAWTAYPLIKFVKAVA